MQGKKSRYKLPDKSAVVLIKNLIEYHANLKVLALIRYGIYRDYSKLNHTVMFRR